MPERKYGFFWGLLGDLREGRPNLGPTTRLEVYRLMQFTLRDVLERRYGPDAADDLFREAGIVAERLRSAIETTPLHCGKGTIRVTASFGVAAFDPASLSGGTYAESLQRVIRQADEALYRAKRSGKNRVEFAA